MNSQYLETYLNENAERGLGNGLTINSFLASRLRGKAKKYGKSYYDGLINSCRRARAVEGKSCRGGVAFYPQLISEIKLNK